MIKGVRVSRTTVLEALFRLGEENHVCLGIELAGEEIVRSDVELHAAHEPALKLVRRLLATTGHYEAVEREGLILIRDRRIRGSTLLDYRLNTFQVQRECCWKAAMGLTFTWRLDGKAETVIALANPSATEAVSYSLYLQYDGGSYTWDGGARLPPGVLAGQAKAVVHNGRGERNKLVGEAIQIDGQGRMTGFLSCPYCPPDPSYVTLNPLNLTGNVGTSQQIRPTIYWADGTWNVNSNPFAIDWYPGNSSVATVSENWSNFQAQFQGPGSTRERGVSGDLPWWS